MRKASPLRKQPVSRSERGRPREFDPDDAAAAAAEIFWKQGYHATSIEALCEATGLMRGSLYGAFGDKHGLLIAAFERFADNVVARLKARLDADLPPRETLREALLAYTRVAAELTDRHGCFITNATLELLPGDEALRPHIEAALRRIAALLTAAVLRGQKAGAFKTSLDGKAVGNFLLCIVQGLRVLGKTDLAGPELIAIVDIAMRAFE